MILHRSNNENMFTELEVPAALWRPSVTGHQCLLSSSSCVPCPKASRGDIGHAVGLLTSQPQQVHDPGDPQQPAASGEAWEAQSGTLDTKHIHPNLSTTACLKSQ